MFSIIEFNKDVFLSGEELDWEIVGVSRYIYADLKKGDRIAVKLHDAKNGWLTTYNQNYSKTLEESDYFSPFISFYEVPESCYVALRGDLEQNQCREFETKNWKDFSYEKPKKKKKI